MRTSVRAASDGRAAAPLPTADAATPSSLLPPGARAAALLCAATVLVEALSPAGAALAVAVSPSVTTTTAQHAPAPDPVRAFLNGLLGGKRAAAEQEQRRREQEEQAEAERQRQLQQQEEEAKRRRGGRWRRLFGRGRQHEEQQQQEQQPQQPQPPPRATATPTPTPTTTLLTAADLANLLGLADEEAGAHILAEELPPSARRTLTLREAQRRLDALARTLRLGPAGARAVAERAPALLALEPALVRARVERDLASVLGVSKDRAAEAARADPGLILAGARFPQLEQEEEEGGGNGPSSTSSSSSAATTTAKTKSTLSPTALRARLRALAALLEVPEEPVARQLAARCPGLLAIPRVDLAGRLALLGRVLSEPERAATQAAAEAADEGEDRAAATQQQQQSSSTTTATPNERRSRQRQRQRLEEQARERRRRDAAARLPQLSEQGLERARLAALEQPSLLSLAARPTALRLRAREAAMLLGLSPPELSTVVARPGGSALLAQPTAVTRARLLALGLLLDASAPDAADAAARAPALVAVPPREIAARLDAVAETLRVSDARARALALERPALLARDVRTIRAAGELVNEAAAKAARQQQEGKRR